MNNLLNYSLIGIGEFSHGIQESWEFRFNLLKYSLKNTDKKIIIFNEMSRWQAENIQNNTIWSKSKNQIIPYNGIRIEKPYKNGNYVAGRLAQYANHTTDSKIFLRIIKFIRKHKKRITIIGIDNDKIDRDYDMYKMIMKNYNPSRINFIWAHNSHISSTPLDMANYKYIKNKKHKWFCGYYLKKKLKNKYCIVLSLAYRGISRFNSYCSGINCATRTWQLKYVYKRFIIPQYKKYVNLKKQIQLIPNDKTTKYKIESFVCFSNSYFRDKKDGIMNYTKTDIFNYILFWNKVNYLR